ncbi:hypothetical protein CCACVL1_24880 [Corchorus capsularis]|uniref:Pentatricopeptide repeat-containing protein n=1 Tax=Corchorus capsularis TaxID=210143 RepID=A0A1R3GMU0_COCAP|nr:hypothetical protein CCACVL1_24880 [Corchorus capsularis]
MPQRNIFSWNSVITALTKCGFIDEAARIFSQCLSMISDRGIQLYQALLSKTDLRKLYPILLGCIQMILCLTNELTLASLVGACATLSAIKEGQQIHARVVKCDKLREDLVLGNALVDMYAKCNRIEDARCVFDGMQVRNVVSETSMVSGYAKAASVKTARLMFTKMTERNIVSWNALIAGYIQNGEDEEALRLFCLLKRESICPTHYTFGNLLNASANLADLQLGRQAHAQVLRHGFCFQFGE